MIIFSVQYKGMGSYFSFMKKIAISIFLILAVFILPFLACAQEANKINLYFFYGDGCPHCAKEEIFLAKLEKDNVNIKIYRYETWHNKDNQQLLIKLGSELGIEVRGVPILIIGDQTITGYYNDEVTGKKITEIVNDYTKNGCNDIVASIIFGDISEPICSHGCDNNDHECLHDCGCSADLENNNSDIKSSLINVPILGEINPANFSLPVLTVIMAAIDGFNPCAMWVLLFLINLLLNIKDQTKMWALGSAFILSSAAVYFVFLAAWLNIVLFMGFVGWIRVLIALVALGSGAYHLWDYYKKQDDGCEVVKSEKRQKVFKNLRRMVLEEKFLFALFGIIILAALVNMVELLCSAGIPAVYVPILTLAHLPVWQFYAYLLLYIFIYMLDDLAVFIIAMKTLELRASDSKYMRYSGLVGGIILLIIGVLLLFKPGLLMFG